MNQDPVTDKQVMALRLMAITHIETGTAEERKLAQPILGLCDQALSDHRHRREARGQIFAIIEERGWITNEMRDTYRRAFADVVSVLPGAPHGAERTAFASRGFEAGQPFLVAGVRVLDAAVQLPVQGSHDRVTALRFLEMHLLTALADVRALRTEIGDEEREASRPRMFARMER